MPRNRPQMRSISPARVKPPKAIPTVTQQPKPSLQRGNSMKTPTVTQQPKPSLQRGNSTSQIPDSFARERTIQAMRLPSQLTQSDQLTEQEEEPTDLDQTAKSQRRNNLCCSCCSAKPKTPNHIETQPQAVGGSDNTMYPGTPTNINSDPAAISMEKSEVLKRTSKDGSVTYNVIIHHNNIQPQPIRDPDL